jgi:hypothetical protein
VEGIEHQSDRWMIRAPHDFPGITVIMDVPSPGKSFEGYAHAPFCSALSEFMEIGRRPLDPAEGIRRDVAAYHKEVAAELFHDVELAFGSGEYLGSLRFWHAFEVAERLERDRLEPEAFDHAPRFSRCAIEGQEIVLEDLHAVELRGRDGLDLLAEGSA